MGQGQRWFASIRVLVVAVTFAAGFGAVQAQSATFGTIREGRSSAAITWDVAAPIEITSVGLLIRPGVTLRSHALRLVPLRLYDLRAVMARDPGVRPRFVVSYLDSDGQERFWSPVWQLPDAPRPDWIPISPSLQQYRDGFVVPKGARDVRLLLSAEASHKQANPSLWWRLVSLDFVAGQSVTYSQTLGANEVVGSDMETPARGGVPVGWSVGSGQAQLVELPKEPSRKHVLRVPAAQQLLLFATAGVMVERGTAWRISLMARGEGLVEVMAHALDEGGMRVGDPQIKRFAIKQRKWHLLEYVWFAQAAGVRYAQPLLQIVAKTDLDIDAVELRPYRR